jgi:hypothetical protein
MSAYFQMGYNTGAIVNDAKLRGYRGCILSPVNETPDSMKALRAELSGRKGFDVVLDPQLYFPRSRRGKLPEWGYFPKDIDTTTLQSDEWWKGTLRELAGTVKEVKATAVCSPAMVPASFTTAYYKHSRQLCDRLQGMVGVPVYQTILARLPELASRENVMRLTSVVSSGGAETMYLVLADGPDPRDEVASDEQVRGVRHLIRELKSAQVDVLVGFCSSDMVLWKDAGATSCATGQFFNLRRFTKGRFDPPSKGGGQVPYWFEESLMAYLREGDAAKVHKEGLLEELELDNPFAQEAWKKIRESKPWLALSWRLYLHWFARAEEEISKKTASAGGMVRSAEKAWATLREKRVRMEEASNDGGWLQAWESGLKQV